METTASHLHAFGALIAAVALFPTGIMQGQGVESVCAGTTWSNCGVAVKEALQKNLTDPRDIVRTGLAWSKAYDTRFNELRKQGRIENATPDADKIFEAVSSKLNPLEIAKDKTVDALVKKYIARLAPIVKWAGGPIADGLKAFFNSSEIATDYDELRLMNDDVQFMLSAQLKPFLDPDWMGTLNRAVKDAGPQLRRP